MTKFFVLLFVSVVGYSQLCSQAFIPSIYQIESDNFYSIVKEFDAYWKDKTPGKGEGYKPFKRWEHFWGPRVYPTGTFPAPDVLYKEQQQYNSLYKGREEKLSPQWQEVGPKVIPTNKLSYNSSGVGRLNCMEADPTNKDILWVGSAAGGLWRSTDGGKNWTTNTDLLPTLGITDIAIHPTNPNIMYIATGDGFGGHTNSLGVMKSTDKGLTWNTTGLTAPVERGLRINRLLIDPKNPNVLIAASSDGAYRTENGGTDWFITKSGWFIDAEFKPGDPNTVYLGEYSWNGRAGIQVSNDNGKTFTKITAGLPASNSLRVELAVSKAEPDLVVALFGRANNQAFLGFYISYDAGMTWELQSNTPNIMSYSPTGEDGRGQAGYNLALAMSDEYPINIFAGGINIWQSQDFGATWNISAHWTGAGGARFVHADQHNFEFIPNTNTLFANNDGGIFFTTNMGATWTDVSSGLGIAQFYKIGVTEQNPNQIIGGTQDNGTHLYRNGEWSHILGGDGMDCAIDPTNPNVLYASLYYADFRRSDNMGNTFIELTGGLPSGAWVSPIVLDPNNSNTVYIGNRQVYKSTNRGNDWTLLSPNVFTNQNVLHIAIPKVNSSRIYAASNSNLFVTTNGGTTWVNRTTGLPNQSITSVTVDQRNENVVYTTFSGYSGSNKVYKSENGGQNWVNISNGLPNVPCNTFAIDDGSVYGTLFAGTDLGVYFRTNSSNAWLPYNNGLPNTIINDLKIVNSSNPKYLVAGTFGRGIWRAPLEVSSLPVSQFGSDNTTVCVGRTVTLTESAGNAPTEFTWLLPGSTTPSASGKSVTVEYANPGKYSITLITKNQFGSDTLTKTDFITVVANPTPTIASFDTTVCQYSIQTYKTTRVAGRSYKWEAEGGKILRVNSDSVVVYWTNPGANTIKLTETVFSSGCTDTKEETVNLTPVATQPIITKQGNTLTASTSANYQWYFNGVAIDGATNQSYEYTTDGTYTVRISDEDTKCFIFSDGYSTITSISETESLGFSITPNPTSGLVTLSLDKNLTGSALITVIDIKSRIIKNLGNFEINGIFQHQLDCSYFANGMYFFRIQMKNGQTITLPFVKQ